MKFRDCIAAIAPYIPGKSVQEIKFDGDIIKLASNENPFGPPVSATELAVGIQKAHMYPHQQSSPVIKKITDQYGITEDQIVLGNGSDDILFLAAQALTNKGDEIITSQHTFSVYSSVARLLEADLITTPMTPDYRYDILKIMDAVTPKTRLIFIANPNNPTGTIVTHQEVTSLLDSISPNILLVMDEAYGEFATDPDYPNQLQLLNKYPNVLFTRTFSKLYGLAGFRIGYGIGNPELIKILNTIRQPFNVNSLALDAADIAIQKKSYIEKTLSNNNAEKERLYSYLDKVNINYIKSETNFVCLFKDTAAELTAFLLKNGVIVRYLHSFGLSNAIRVSVGLPEEMTRLTILLEHYLEENK